MQAKVVINPEPVGEKVDIMKDRTFASFNIMSQGVDGVNSGNGEFLKPIVQDLARIASASPHVLSGYSAIEELRAVNSTQWRQMEWPGFYYEERLVGMLADANSKHLYGPGPQYGNSIIDGWIENDGIRKPIDIKTHALGKTHTILLNDSTAINACLDDYGVYYVLSVDCRMDYDDAQGTFKQWRDLYQGGQLKASKQNATSPVKRNSRRRKVGLSVEEYRIYEITPDNIHLLGNFNQGRQHNGTTRNVKYKLNTRKLAPVVSIQANID